MIFKHTWEFYYSLRNEIRWTIKKFIHRLGFHDVLEAFPKGGTDWMKCPGCDAQWNGNDYCVRKP